MTSPRYEVVTTECEVLGRVKSSAGIVAMGVALILLDYPREQTRLAVLGHR